MEGCANNLQRLTLSLFPTSSPGEGELWTTNLEGSTELSIPHIQTQVLHGFTSTLGTCFRSKHNPFGTESWYFCTVLAQRPTEFFDDDPGGQRRTDSLGLVTSTFRLARQAGSTGALGRYHQRAFSRPSALKR